jgi:hypothetical protein
MSAKLKGQYSYLIICFTGNYLLSTVLPQIYSQNRQAVLNSVDKLVNVISVCDVSERASLIQVFGMISKHEPKVIVIAVVKETSHSLDKLKVFYMSTPWLKL